MKLILFKHISFFKQHIIYTILAFILNAESFCVVKALFSLVWIKKKTPEYNDIYVCNSWQIVLKTTFNFLKFDGKHHYQYQVFISRFLFVWLFISFKYILLKNELSILFPLIQLLTAKFFSMSKWRCGFSSWKNLSGAV